MLPADARRPARADADGSLIRLADQDRALWGRARIDEGLAWLRACPAAARPGPYQLQAGINAAHAVATDASATDWPAILRLYDQLLAVSPGPVVALNRAVAVAEVEGAEPGLAALDPLALDGYHLFHEAQRDRL